MSNKLSYHNQAIQKQGRLKSLAVTVGDLLIGAGSSIKIQTMTTTNTMNTQATVAEAIRCIESGAQLVRITTPSLKEAKNLRAIKDELRLKGFQTPLVADVHFTAKAAEIAAEIVAKVRINPGNYVDKNQAKEYSNSDYTAEIERIYQRLRPLLGICKREGTALRIGVNHGSLSNRILMRYGDTPIGMVESAMEFLRITRAENFHNIVLSMKSSNPIIMVQAYRLLVMEMLDKFQASYPLHLGVTEAGDGLSARVKSASGIGTLLAEGLGDTLRVSLTEDPEFELPVAALLAEKFTIPSPKMPAIKLSYNPVNYQRQVPPEHPALPLGKQYPPLVIADAYGIINTNLGQNRQANLQESFDFSAFGYNLSQNEAGESIYHKENIAADMLVLPYVPKEIPASLKLIIPYRLWEKSYSQNPQIFPLCSLHDLAEFSIAEKQELLTNLFIFVNITEVQEWAKIVGLLRHKNLRSLGHKALLFVKSDADNSALVFRNFALYLHAEKLNFPIIWSYSSKAIITQKSVVNSSSIDALSVDIAGTLGGVLIDGIGAGLCLLGDSTNSMATLLELSFVLLQSTRLRVSSPDYISCPSCGRTLFDLQAVTQKIKQATGHLRGVKIGIMGCIVNGPGEMADADFGYVGSGKNKVNLYKGQEIVRRNVDSDLAVEALISLIKEYGMWVEP